MKLTFTNTEQLNQAWNPDFLGLQGFLVPNYPKFNLGQELEITLVVNKQNWGNAKVKVCWQNRYGQNSEHTPRGNFLKITSADSTLSNQLGIN